jgi:integrase
MRDTGSTARAPARKRKKKHRGVYEHPKGSNEYWIVFYDQHRTRHREKVGAYSLAVEVYRKRKNEVREGRYFPGPKTVWNPLFSEHVQDYLARTASTRIDARGAQRYARFFREAPETKGKRMRDLARHDFERYRERRLQHGDAPGCLRQRGAVSATTVNKELRFAHAVFVDFLAALVGRRDEPIPNPLWHLSLPEPKHRTRFLCDDEEVCLQTVMAPADWPPVLVAIMTGLDRGPMFALEWEQVDLTTRTIFAERRKGCRRRSEAIAVRIPINEELLQVLRALPSRLTSRWVFPNAAGTGPFDGDVFDRLVFRPALKAAGITGLRWKDLRHTFATRLRMQRGADLKSIAELLGHTSTRMTERYAHATTTHLHDLVQGLSRVPAIAAPTATRTATSQAAATAAPDHPLEKPRLAR